MFETFKQMRPNLIIASFGWLAIGLLLLIAPNSCIEIACYVLGALFVAGGVLTILKTLKARVGGVGSVLFGILIIAVGIFIISNPDTIASIIPIIFGLIFLVDGCANIRHGLGMRGYDSSSWASVTILGLVTILLGLIILLHPYGTATLGLRLIGGFLLFNGLSDLFIINRVNHTARDVYNHDKRTHLIDVNPQPVDDDEEDS